MRKYRDIRATHSRRQAVKQVWLAYLAEREPTAFEDSDLTWPDDLALLGPDESARGRLVLIPPPRLPDGEEDDDSPGWIPAPRSGTPGNSSSTCSASAASPDRPPRPGRPIDRRTAR